MKYFIARHRNRNLTLGLIQYESYKDRPGLARFFQEDFDTEVEPCDVGDAALHRGGYTFRIRPGDYIRPGELVIGYEGDSTYVYPQDIIETHFELEEMPPRIGILSGFIACAQDAGEEWLYYSGVENGPYDEDD